jgi:hypothetical protein
VAESPPTRRRSRAPHPEPDPNQNLNEASVTPAADSIPAQLRRRRAASYRLPPLHDGRRDPLDPPPDDGKPATIVMTEDRHSVYFHGDERVLRRAVREVGCRYMFDPRTRVMSVPKRFADHVAVAVETGTPRGIITDRGLW